MRCFSYILLLLLPAAAFGQFNPYASVNGDPRVRRAAREYAVARVGTSATRAFVETPYGDEAAAATFACSVPVARKLVEFHASGELDRLIKPRELLAVIARHGDDVAIFAIQNAHALQDQDSLEAFLANPVEIAVRLRPLDVAASEMRARRLNPTPGQPQPTGYDWRIISLVVGAAGIVGLVLWRRRRNAAS